MTSNLNPTAVVFLDIDGVLEGWSSQDRFSPDLEALREELVRPSDPGYATLDRHDIGAANKTAIDLLTRICE